MTPPMKFILNNIQVQTWNVEMTLLLQLSALLVGQIISGSLVNTADLYVPMLLQLVLLHIVALRDEPSGM